jgi:hypothetical protein
MIFARIVRRLPKRVLLRGARTPLLTRSLHASRQTKARYVLGIETSFDETGIYNKLKKI